MNKPIIEVKKLSKVYNIGHEQKSAPGTLTFRDSLTQTIRKPLEIFTGHRIEQEKFWALRDVNFEINKGDVVGIIGRNGSGKSTLLKVLSRIVEPTEGEITMRGRVASLLEVGTGFHPELTGRENVYFNGAILGMSQKEIKSKFDEIVAFSEVGKFLDTPVKFYSSGMYVRLAFAVAAHLDPDILIVDEVLAVGDAAFQKKCLGKMQQVAREGRTVLFVSHSMESVRRLCTKGILLDQGRIVDAGSIGHVISKYYNFDGVKKAIWSKSSENLSESETNEYLRILGLKLLVGNKLVTTSVPNNRLINVEITGVILKASPSLNVGLSLVSNEGETIYWSFNTDSLGSQQESNLKLGKFLATVSLPKHLLNEGDYTVEALASLHNQRWLYEPNKAPSVRLSIRAGLSESSYWQAKRPGVNAPLLQWEIH